MVDSARKRSAEAVSITDLVEAPTLAAQHRRAVAPNDRLLRTRELLAVLGVCRATLHVMVRDGKFPRPLKQGAHCRWLRSDADRYLKARLAECETEPLGAIAC
jgi:predicted DNA-binding transcriptional regulator AlpA